jgi:hypothetical protein
VHRDARGRADVDAHVHAPSRRRRAAACRRRRALRRSGRSSSRRPAHRPARQIEDLHARRQHDDRVVRSSRDLGREVDGIAAAVVVEVAAHRLTRSLSRSAAAPWCDRDSNANGHRGWKWQPVGGSIGLGTSPPTDEALRRAARASGAGSRRRAPACTDGTAARTASRSAPPRRSVPGTSPPHDSTRAGRRSDRAR